MPNMTPSESSGVPQKIQTAEAWRVAGAKLRRLAPEVYEQIFAMLVASLPGDYDRDNDPDMLRSYFVT